MKARVIALLILSVGLCFLVSGSWIQIKAFVAQALLERSWQQTLEHGNPVQPWPWADHWPVAQLKLQKSKSEFIVLSGDSGSSLAFAPGWNTKSAKPGVQGVTVISGHRDTHFKILKDTEIGDSIEVVTTQGETVNYKVKTIEIVDSRVATINTEQSGQTLVLVTCFPFDVVVAGGSLRYVVTAEAVT
ncbi:MAG TPA: class GN sortase [Methylococcaceae bacterium]|nr:class GN sortase [Methylococcaceae bacterium]HIA45962.1 class GN sortase [Methylococcaceae bacterium]HIB62232.1 class GN sortase [Methylococcaceae bacterium]HIN68039.1 class GN sortase [Methylococcales bacterium]HIO44514.1 class GN sortase [Methylococcales bacterium]